MKLFLKLYIIEKNISNKIYFISREIISYPSRCVFFKYFLLFIKVILFSFFFFLMKYIFIPDGYIIFSMNLLI